MIYLQDALSVIASNFKKAESIVFKITKNGSRKKYGKMVSKKLRGN